MSVIGVCSSKQNSPTFILGERKRSILSQQLIMEADYDDFIINQEYLEAVPRATEAEIKGLDLKLIQRGQLVPITVNRKMVILDGYTRHDLLGQRGKKIKYIFMDFENKEDELNFVRETNVMRRHMNPFQRVETMYEQLKHEREMRRLEISTGFTDTLLSMKNGNTTAKTIAKDMEVSLKYINRTVKKMTEQWYVGRNPDPNTNAGYIYHVMPKGEELLIKSKQVKMGRIEISDIIGVRKQTINKAMHLIANASESLLRDIRTNKIGLVSAYKEFMGQNRITPSKYYRGWTPYSKIKCPHCDHVSNKKEYMLVE